MLQSLIAKIKQFFKSAKTKEAEAEAALAAYVKSREKILAQLAAKIEVEAIAEAKKVAAEIEAEAKKAADNVEKEVKSILTPRATKKPAKSSKKKV